MSKGLRIAILVAFGCLATIAGCSHGSANWIARDPSSSRYDITVSSMIGSNAYVLLPQNSASTGYTWQLDPLPSDANIALASHALLPLAHPDGLTGATGGELWTFRVIGEGTTTLRARYIRTWNPPLTPPAIEAAITVHALDPLK